MSYLFHNTPQALAFWAKQNRPGFDLSTYSDHDFLQRSAMDKELTHQEKLPSGATDEEKEIWIEQYFSEEEVFLRQISTESKGNELSRYLLPDGRGNVGIYSTAGTVYAVLTQKFQVPSLNLDRRNRPGIPCDF